MLANLGFSGKKISDSAQCLSARSRTICTVLANLGFLGKKISDSAQCLSARSRTRHSVSQSWIFVQKKFLTPRSVCLRGVTYFVNISLKTNFYGKPF